MISNHLNNRIKAQLPYVPNEGQEILIQLLSAFITHRTPETLFLLKGYAGTGKTSLIGSLVKCLVQLKMPIALLAPTGRAAKVFTSYSNQPAFTIHKKIYRQKSAAFESGFGIMPNLHKETLFIVDEASLINNESFDNSMFGTGRLLDDLIEYVYSQESCNMILIGDSAQLPPVGQTDSPALKKTNLESYGLRVIEHTLREVARQSQESGILHNATKLRNQIENNLNLNDLPQLDAVDFPDLICIDGNELPDIISNSYGNVGMEETILITRSNKRANIFNQGVRGRVLYREEELSNGDLLMITKNNYFWSKDYEEIPFIANGEIAEVVRVRNEVEMYNFRFADVTLRFLDLDIEVDAKLLLDSLHSDAPSLPKDQQEKLFLSVMEDYVDIPTKSEKFKKLKVDPYFNSFQAKFAYATTCHKAQGGQWKYVILDLGNIRTEYLGSDFYRWLYTSLTRATEKVFLLNTPNQMLL
ncbi:MAG: ATP-dependent DNA helicase [Bacteroidales bacterium]